MRCRHSIGFYILLFIIFCVPVVSYSEGLQVSPWLGSYAANKIPLREVISSKYLIHISTGAQSALSTRLEEDKQRFITDCKSDGGHAIVNTTISVSVGEVLLGGGSATQYGFLLTFAGDCVTDSKLAAK